MNSILNGFASGANSSQMMQRMNENFKNSDSDGNGSVSKTEAMEAFSVKGIDSNKAEKIFSRLDVNGDGEFTLKEKQKLMAVREERINSFMSGDSGETKDFNSITTLLDALSKGSTDTDQKQRIEGMLEKMQSNGGQFTAQSELSSLFNELIPPVDDRA